MNCACESLSTVPSKHKQAMYDNTHASMTVVLGHCCSRFLLELPVGLTRYFSLAGKLTQKHQKIHYSDQDLHRSACYIPATSSREKESHISPVNRSKYGLKN